MDPNNRIDGHLVILVSIEHYNPLSMIRGLGKNGISPIYIAVKGKGKIASISRYVSLCHYVDSVEEAYEFLLKEYGNEEVKPFVLTGDDKTIAYLDRHYEDLKDHFIVFNAGRTDGIIEYMDKSRILEIARKHGLNVLDTKRVPNGTIPEDLVYPVITKSISPVIGGWKSDVFICENEEELKKAYASIKTPEVILQKYIDKKNEYAMEGYVIDHGRKAYYGVAMTYNYLIKGYYSPYFTVHNADREEINQKLSEVFEEIGFEGIFEVEFLIDQDDTLYFGEINFRNSPWSYPTVFLKQPIIVDWMKSMLKGEVVSGTPVIPENYTGMNEPIDYEKRVNGGMISQAQWLYDFKKADVTFYYDPDDPEPYYLMMNNFNQYN
ncbi:MAG: ATP-grasp domain-containing protein [Erysipelotrichaceae bacterium]|nr:ATP-grasp domain-containing protein [Erysipelotrichaceae bacterium]